jgi:hypothetical protein
MRAVALIVLLAGVSGPAWAQDAAAPTPTPTVDPTAIDATKLGVSLSRIQKALQIAEARQKDAGGALRLEFNIQVFGTAPKIEILKGVDLLNGQVPGTAPSHTQFIEFVTPPIYRQPALPISAFAAWAAQRVWQQSKRARCEEEIANYRAQVMQGMNVSAPRCTQ